MSNVRNLPTIHYVMKLMLLSLNISRLSQSFHDSTLFFVSLLEPGTKMIKLRSRSELTKGCLLSVWESLTLYEKKMKY